MKKLLLATAALAMFAAFGATAEPEGRIRFSGHVLAPTACRAESASIRNATEFKLFCGMGANGIAATPVHRVALEAMQGSTTTYVVQITYL